MSCEPEADTDHRLTGFNRGSNQRLFRFSIKVWALFKRGVRILRTAHNDKKIDAYGVIR